MVFAGSLRTKIICLNIYILIIFSIEVEVATKVFAQIREKPVVVITVDAETTSKHGFRNISLPDQYDLKIGDVYCGVTKMMDICDKHNVKATIFLNVYEHKKYGEQVLQKIARDIDDRGFDVQLHTHPQWAYDNKRNMMHQYSMSEQIKIIKDGKDLIKKWINKEPVIHRAGAYGANEDTLKALRANNIFFDSSFFIVWASSLRNLGLMTNYISISNGVYQIPVNTFFQEQHARWFDFLGPLERIAKYDIDMLTYDAMIKAIDKGIENQFDVITLFLHSFTFINEYSEGKKVADIVDINEFDNVLEYIKERGLRVVTFNSFINEFNRGKHVLRNSDFIPTVSTRIDTSRFMLKKAGVNRRNIRMVIIYASVVSVLLAITLACFLLRKRSKDKTSTS